jgi:hypothetical protein
LQVQFAQKLGLAGAMVWSVNSDDLKGYCGKGNNPLLSAIHAALTSGKPPSSVDNDSGRNDIDAYGGADLLADNGSSSQHLRSSTFFCVFVASLMLARLF